MTVLSRAETIQWIEDHGFAPTPNQVPVVDANEFHLVFMMPNQPCDQLVLAYDLAEWFGDGEAMLWMTDWPIYSEEMMRIFEGIRNRSGKAGRLIDAPGHLLSSEQPHQARAIAELLHCLFAFNWEGFLYAADRSCTIWVADYDLVVSTTDSRQWSLLKPIVEAVGTMTYIPEREA